MKKLLLISILFISIGALAQTPNLNDGQVTVQANLQNEYYVDYSQFVGPLLMYPMGWGVGYIDLNTRTFVQDSYVDHGHFDCEAWFNSKYLKFSLNVCGLPGTTTRHDILYTVSDIYGHRSNVARLRLNVQW